MGRARHHGHGHLPLPPEPTTPGRVHHRQLDVADLDTPQPFVAQVIDEFVSLDLLLPNAGIAPVHTLPDIDLATWQETLTVNLTAPFLLAQAAVPDMVNRGYGRILFTSSAAAFVGGFVGPLRRQQGSTTRPRRLPRRQLHALRSHRERDRPRPHL